MECAGFCARLKHFRRVFGRNVTNQYYHVVVAVGNSSIDGRLMKLHECSIHIDTSERYGGDVLNFLRC